MRKEYFDKLVKLIKKSEMDAILIAPSEDMQFIVGHTPYLCERFQGMFIKENGEYFYVCNLLTADEMSGVLGKDIKVYPWFDGDYFADTIVKAFNDFDLMGKKIGINSAVRGFHMVEIEKRTAVEFVNGKSVLEELRIIKSSTEADNLRIAAKIADETFMELLKTVEVGVKEKDLKETMFSIFKSKGASKSYGLISCGVNTAYPHYNGTDGVVKEKDIIMFDIGCVYNEMCSDMTRTIFVGEITEEEKKIYDIVLRANKNSEDKIAPNAYIPDIDNAARKTIENEGYGEYFTTRLGHGIGYGVHEAPDIKKNNERYLEKGMAFSVEPGIYMPGKFGIRIEDIVLVTEDGKEVLNKASKDIIVKK